MMAYLINFTLCSALLFAVYALLLQNKVIYGFNRFYLLLAIGFSLLVPLITIEQAVPAAQSIIKEQVPDLKDDVLVVIEGTEPSAEVKPGTNYGVYACVSIYIIITACLLMRFAINLFKLTRLIKTNERVAYHQATLVLINDNIAPHSFLNYIFLSKDDYHNGHIGKDILQHEQAHISQRHSIDILLIELLQALCWFNPVLILYRHAIRLNHEFLADAAVLSHNADVKTYQYLLLHQFSQTPNLAIASSFNYSNTKKRLIMMTRKTTVLSSAVGKMAAVAAMSCAFVMFCQKTQAFQQDQIKAVKQSGKPGKQSALKSKKGTKSKYTLFSKYPHTKEGVSEQLINEYASIVAKYDNAPKNDNKFFPSIADDDKARMEVIYRQMNIEQQMQQKIGFRTPFPKLPKRTITQQELQSWKENVNIYGVWVDEKRVKNEDLTQYTTADFSRYSMSKLAPNAKNYKNHKYQIDLMTNAAYQRYLNEPQPKYLMYHKYRPVTEPAPIGTVSFPSPNSSK